MALRLGVSSGAFYPDLPTEAVPAAAAALGLPELELMLQTAGEYAPGFFAELLRAADDAGCLVRSLHTMQTLHPLAAPYKRRAEEGRTLFRQAIDGAVALGAKAIVWHGLSRQEAAGADAWPAFLRATELLAGHCGEAGVTLAIENVSWCVLATVRDVLAFVARIPELGPPGSIGLTFDPFQAAEAGANPFMVLAAMEPALVDVHLSDRRETEPGHRHLPPGDGDLPWPALIRAVAASSYDGPMMIEGPLKEAGTIERVRALLDPLIASACADDDPCSGLPPAGVREGIRLYNARRFYEAHEELEHEWHAERRPIRRLYQGILQIGVGFHHARGGNHKGAVLLLTDGIAKTSAFVPSCQGLDLARLVRESQACLDEIVRLGPDRLSAFDWAAVPTIHEINGEL